MSYADELLASAAGDHSEERWDSGMPPPPNREAYPPDGELVYELNVAGDDEDCPPTLPGVRSAGAGGTNEPAGAGEGKP